MVLVDADLNRTLGNVMRLTCLLLATLLSSSDSNKVLSPQNVSLYWKSDFEPEFSWLGPKSNCSYLVTANTQKNDNKEAANERWLTNPPYSYHMLAMDGGTLNFSVRTICNKATSRPTYYNVTYPDLVKDLRCCVISSKKTVCSWQPTSALTYLQFFYRGYQKQGLLSALQECPSYIVQNGMKMGCNLPPIIHRLYVLLNSTGEVEVIRNTFRFIPVPVLLAPLKMTIIKHADTFEIHWAAPDMFCSDNWKFNISYTECDQAKREEVENQLSKEINRVSHCQYRLSIRAECNQRYSRWSDPVYFDSDVNPLVYMIIIPVVLSILILPTLVCFRKYKDVIFPKVPEPKNLLDSDINKVKVCNLPTPTEEERICDVVIVPSNNTDSQTKGLL